MRVKLSSLTHLESFPPSVVHYAVSIFLIHQTMCLRIRERDKCRHTRCFHPLHIPYVIIPYGSVRQSSSQIPSTIITILLEGTPWTLPHMVDVHTLINVNNPSDFNDTRCLRMTRRCLSLVHIPFLGITAVQSQTPNCNLEV